MGQQVAGDVGTQRTRGGLIGDSRERQGAAHEGATGVLDGDVEGLRGRVGPDGRRAAGLQRREHLALRGDGPADGGRVQPGERRAHLLVVGAALHGQRALAGGRDERGGVEELADLVRAPDPGQPGRGQDDGVELAGGHEAHAGVDVAADGDDLEVGSQGQQQCLPAG